MALALFIGVSISSESQAADSLTIRIDLSEQLMTVRYSGIFRHTWPVSTAQRGYRTPIGAFRPYLLKRMHYSSKYDWAPMPFSVFFLKGYAIHGATEIRNLGNPVSHGCIRLHPDHARTLFNLIKQYGKEHTLIRINR